jgi:nitrogen fixation protein FixH
MTDVSAQNRSFEVTGRFVLLCVVGFFLTIAAVNGVMIRFAVATFGGVETESSYKAGLAFKAETAASAAQEQLGWKVDVRIVPRAEGARVHVGVRDAAGAPVPGLEIAVNAAHPADRRRDVPLPASEMTSGAFFASAPAGLGRRILTIEFARNGERVFRSVNRVALP